MVYRPETIVKEDDNNIYYPYVELRGSKRGIFNVYPGKLLSITYYF